MNPETCGFLHSIETRYCNWIKEDKGMLHSFKTCGIFDEDHEKRFCYAEGPPNIWGQDIPRHPQPTYTWKRSSSMRVMKKEEVNAVNQLLKTDFPLRVIYEDRRYVVPGGILIELLTEISHLKEALDICKEAAEH